ncbi:MAG: lipid A biosynthesis acyltransferase [Alphaproteobacteria bacterium]|nr:MAG: lipid A biosynthesis acyltransferase [Alphaproteobacteria bacterium]
MKNIRYFFEAVLLYILFIFFKILPPATASNIGGWIGRTIGSKLAASRKARRHIQRALPNTTQQEQDDIIKGMWDNLGRVIAEYSHLEHISKVHTEIVDLGQLNLYIQDEAAPILFIGGHLANWEINSAATLTQLNHPVDLTYRAPNNPWVAKMLDKARTLNGRLKAYPKSRESGRLIMKTLKDAGSLGILIDQKYNEGIEVDFFDMPAMTNPIFVQLCQRYKCPLIPVRNERLEGCRFKLTSYPPLETFKADGTPRAVEDVIKDAHQLLETWIKERPEQWMWLHHRWKD